MEDFINFIKEIFTGLWTVWKEMYGAFAELFPKVVYFIFWVLSGILILPCVFVAGNIYPKWVEWGEKM